MAKIELTYTEIDGLLYPNIEIEGREILDNLGKYGTLRLRYLHEHKPGMYRELLFTGELAKHCADIDKIAFEQAERIRDDYLKAHPMPDDDTLEHIRISVQAQIIADEIVLTELTYS